MITFTIKPLASLIVLETTKIVNNIVNKLFQSGNINTMTHKWLKIGLQKPCIPEFYTLTKIHKKIPVGRPIVSGSSGHTEHISSFVDITFTVKVHLTPNFFLLKRIHLLFKLNRRKNF